MKLLCDTLGSTGPTTVAEASPASSQCAWTHRKGLDSKLRAPLHKISRPQRLHPGSPLTEDSSAVELHSHSELKVLFSAMRESLSDQTYARIERLVLEVYTTGPGFLCAL